MGRRRNPVPRYTLHKSSGQARVCFAGREIYLGVYGSPESRAEYARIVAELQAAAAPQVVARVTSGVTLDEVLLAFWKHAERHYRRPDDTPTNEQVEFRHAIKPLRELYGHTPAAAFGPLALQAVRDRMIAAGWCRTTLNNRVRRLKHIFKWAVAQELVPPAVYQGLASVAGLQKGRTKVREPEPVEPVAEADARAVLPFVRPPVAAMIELQLLTGARPGEVCRIRPCDIDTSGDVWIYRPQRHKTEHRGKGRAIAIGPQGRAVLQRFTPADPTDYYFSPRRTVADLHASRTKARATPKFASHVKRNAEKRTSAPKRAAGGRYKVESYALAVARGCKKAGVALWSPNQLRHAHGTNVRRRYGLEAAQVVLGHEHADVTQRYAERDLTLAAKVAAEIG